MKFYKLLVLIYLLSYCFSRNSKVKSVKEPLLTLTNLKNPDVIKRKDAALALTNMTLKEMLLEIYSKNHKNEIERCINNSVDKNQALQTLSNVYSQIEKELKKIELKKEKEKGNSMLDIVSQQVANEIIEQATKPDEQKSNDNTTQEAKVNTESTNNSNGASLDSLMTTLKTQGVETYKDIESEFRKFCGDLNLKSNEKLTDAEIAVKLEKIFNKIKLRKRKKKRIHKLSK